jgi:hypothetical protein
MGRLSAGRKRDELTDGNTPFRPIAIETRPLLMTRYGMDSGVVNRGCDRESGRKISAEQEGAHGGKFQHSLDPSESRLAAAPSAIHPHTLHLCE